METKFQTSFIPKKPIVPIGGASVPTVHHASSSLFLTISTFVFMVSLISVVGVYAWKSVLTKTNESYKKTLSTKQNQFNISLIDQLNRANVKIDLSQKLLANHLAISQIFDVIGRFTIENVRFSNMDLLATTDQKDSIKFSLSGVGSNLTAVAFQSKVLGQLENYGLRKKVKNPMMSDPTLNPSGKVSFGFTATVDNREFNYENFVKSSGIASSTENNTQ